MWSFVRWYYRIGTTCILEQSRCDFIWFRHTNTNTDTTSDYGSDNDKTHQKYKNKTMRSDDTVGPACRTSRSSPSTATSWVYPVWVPSYSGFNPKTNNNNESNNNNVADTETTKSTVVRSTYQYMYIYIYKL